MKCWIVQRHILSIFMVLMLALSIQGIAAALIPNTFSVPIPRYTPEGTLIATKVDIAISEVMYATDASGSPQWIELHNRSTEQVSLEGWEVTIENHPEDQSVLSTKLTFTLGEKVLDANQVLLLVTEPGDSSGLGTATGDFQTNHVVILKDLVGGTLGYRLLSETAFKITLTVPSTTKTTSKTAGDIAGNLGVAPEWKLSLNDGERISILRKYNIATQTPLDGITADGWELATEKNYPAIGRPTYYGHHSDHSTPGYRESDPLPVEISSFRPVRKRSGSPIVITWVTQSEVNNAGFNIKRSDTKDGKFKTINSVVIPGAGTTTKQRVYTYTDTTVKPKVIYYYQIESISVDGTRRILRTTHLRGNVGGANKRLQYYLKQ